MPFPDRPKGITDVITMTNEEKAQVALGTMKMYVVELWQQLPPTVAYNNANWNRKRNAKVVASSASEACDRANKYFPPSFMFLERLRSYPFEYLGDIPPGRATDDYCNAYRTDKQRGLRK